MVLKVRKIWTEKFDNTFIGEIVEFNGKLGKVVEVNHDVCARLRPLNFLEKVLTKAFNVVIS